MHRRVLITGCGRSGTIYTSTLLGACGLEVPHENNMGKDGIASWLFGAESSTAPWGPAPSEYSFEHIVHLVRNPLSSIPSITTFKRSAWDYITRQVPIDPSDPLLLRAAKYWLYWNELVEKRAHLRLRIEEMPGAIATLCDRIGSPVGISPMREIPTDLNTRRYGRLFNLFETECLGLGFVRQNTLLKKMLARLPPMYADITWSDLRALDPSLAERVCEKALSYGYQYPSRSACIGG